MNLPYTVEGRTTPRKLQIRENINFFQDLSYDWRRSRYITGLMGQSSDSQPGCSGTQGCREVVRGVPPNILFFCYLLVFLVKIPFFCIKGASKHQFAYIIVPPHVFSQKRCRGLEKVKKHWVRVMIPNLGTRANKDAVKRCQKWCQILNLRAFYLFFYCLGCLKLLL